MSRVVTLIPGDGIGPEITDATVEILEAAGADLTWDRQIGGMAAVDAGLPPLPEETIASVRENRVALKGPLTTPVGVGFRSINVALRREFDLYANVRPGLTVLPGGRYEDIDLVRVRGNTEGVYCGFEHYITSWDLPRPAAEALRYNARQD